MRPFVLATISAVLLGPGAAAADPALGKWVTEPDRKGQVGIIDVHVCAGEQLCGQIVSAYDAGGEPVMTPNVGRMVFWKMEPTAPNEYEGVAWVPAHDETYYAGMTLMGDRLKVHGCRGLLCGSQVWKRVE